MTKIKRIVTSEVEGRNLTDFYGDNSIAIDSNGVINYYGTRKMGPLLAPGVLYGSNANSGDGYGYNTIKLIPHAPNGDVFDDRYLIIDPTAPNHIHIRAGGTQDESSAELYLGAEKTYVKVNDSSRSVTISSKQQQAVQAVLNVNDVSNDYLLFNDVVPVTSNSGWYTEVNGTKYYVAEVTYPTEGQTLAYVPGAPLQASGVYNMFSPEATNQWQFDSSGNIYGPGEGYQTTFTKIGTTNNDGSGQNVKIGDDAWIGDVNNSNRVAIIGVQDSLEGGILFGERLGEKIYTDGENLTIEAAQGVTLNAVGGNMNFFMDGGMYIGVADSNNQIIKRSDLNALPQSYFQSVRWTPNFTATGLTFTGTDTTHPTYQSHYVKQGQLVSFWIAVDCATVTSFGTGQLKLELPFAPLPGTMNHFSGWVYVDSTANPDLEGHIILNADHLSNTSVLDLHYIKSAGGANSPVMEAMLMQNTPATLTTLTRIYVNGTYIAAE